MPSHHRPACESRLHQSMKREAGRHLVIKKHQNDPRKWRWTALDGNGIAAPICSRWFSSTSITTSNVSFPNEQAKNKSQI